MQASLQRFGVGLVLLSLAPSTLSFSLGASRASCREMIPGHIRAQPQDLQRSHVTLRTSASSYLPGQLVTVTVRSSRDFMGFLLQARSVEAPSLEAGVRARSLGPVLVGGSWTLTPPGTHTLHCLSEGDTLTHSDKQLKRNLSFVWRAPDAPMGDIRFYVTVVQSYFVYWAGIESAVVRDGSRSPWSWRNITGADGGNSAFALQEDEVTALPALKAHTALKKQTYKTTNPASTPGSPTTTNSGTKSYKLLGLLTEVTSPVLQMNSSVTFLRVDRITHQAFNKRNSPVPLGSLSGVNGKARTDEKSPVTHTNTPRSLSNHIPPMASAEYRVVRESTTVWPKITGKNSTSSSLLQHSLASIPPLKDTEMERTLQDTKPTGPDTKANPLSPETKYSLYKTNHQRPTSKHPRGLIQDQTSSEKFETQSSSSPTWRTSLNDEMGNQTTPMPQHPNPEPSLNSQTSSFKSNLQIQTSPHEPFLQSQTIPFFKASSSKPFTKSQTSLPNHILPPKHPTLESFTKSYTNPSFPQTLPNKQISSLPRPTPGFKSRQTSPTLPQLPTPSPLTETPLSLSSFPQAIPQDIPTQTQGRASFPESDQSKSETLPADLTIFPQALSQTDAPNLSSSSSASSTPSISDPSSPLASSTPSISDPSSPLASSTRSISDPSSSPSASSTPSISLQSSSPLTSTPSISDPSSSPSASSTPSISDPSSLSASSTPSISDPSSPLASSTPSISDPSSPLASSTPSIFDPSSSPLASSTPSIFDPSSSPSASSTPSISDPPSSLSISSTSASSSSSIDLSSFLNSSATSSTSPHPGPSPAPRRSIFNPLTSTSSSVLSKQLTLGQKLANQNHILTSGPEPNLDLPTPGTVIHPNPDPHPNFNPNFKLKPGHKLTPNSDTKPKRPSDPVKTPEKEGKLPDIIPRHSSWELGMLLGCSAGLGMVLVVGVRYMYRQACGKQTEVTLHDREREYARGERGLLHVQECGDLVRVRRIRENSFVLLAEYDILASPGDLR
ncbi:hypothetical protein PBY51_005788 [Eleginops maclovinus]|uniref:Reelin domain-containing protein n=2 Tax=Eleginops maclovinus TaxID=56733 RepID=A0AAN7WCW7_ELEMC|nr:hypothetical protein PBY51_005788 [Eleginops maclovinus]